MESKGFKFAVAEVTSIPSITVPVQDPAAVAAVTKLIDILEEHDDVKEVYTNADLPEAA
jgi:transcriptional/translational regulatory protein YebC/TACO1